MVVVELDAVGTHDLRRRVLRDHLPGAPVDNPEDARSGTVHLGIRSDGGDVVAVATLTPEQTVHRGGVRAVRLRGMAVDPAWRGKGVGARLLEALVDRARADGYEVLWANGRDGALGFYERHGWQVVGEGFVTMALPHHVVLVDLHR